MPSEPIKSAVRTLSLLERFASVQRPMSVNEISAIMEMPQSSTSVLVKSMVTLGYLEHNPADRTYYPTMRVALLGTWMLRRHEETQRLPNMLLKIAEQTHESAVISMRNGIYAQHLFTQSGPSPLRLHIDSGMLFPLCCTAPGWALLSTETDVEIGKIVRRTQAEAPVERWKHTSADAIPKVAEFRANGYVMSAGQTVEGVSSISMLLPAQGRRPMAVSVGGPINRIHAKAEHIIETMQNVLSNTTSEAMNEIADAAEPADRIAS